MTTKKIKHVSLLATMFCIFFASLYAEAPVLTPAHQKIQEMYQEQNLEPGFLGGFINWGYWTQKSSNHISDEERIEASKDLYREVFKAAAISSTDTVLEVGCGKGKGVELLFEERHPLKAVGLDLNSKFISLARKKNAGQGLIFLEGDACNFQFSEKFSKIICVEASQHFLNMDAFLSSAYKNLEKEGQFVIAGFFANKEQDISYLKDKIWTIKNDIDIVRSIISVKEELVRLHFKDVQITSIGAHVIPQYEDWLKQVNYANIWAKEWKDAFEKSTIDYYIIVAKKAD